MIIVISMMIDWVKIIPMMMKDSTMKGTITMESNLTDSMVKDSTLKGSIIMDLISKEPVVGDSTIMMPGLMKMILTMMDPRTNL